MAFRFKYPETPTHPELVELYSRVNEELTVHGWTKSHSVDLAGRMCLMGAVSKVLQDDPEDMWAGYTEKVNSGFMAVRDELRDHLGESPMLWNDHRERTRQDVDNLLEEMEAVHRAASTVVGYQ